MGAWGYEPYASDTASDFFNTVLQGEILDQALRDGFEFEDDYAKLRAACYLIERLALIWTGNDDLLKEKISEGIQRLSELISPEMQGDDHDFLERWEETAEICKEVRRQISSLKTLSEHFS